MGLCPLLRVNNFKTCRPHYVDMLYTLLKTKIIALLVFIIGSLLNIKLKFFVVLFVSKKKLMGDTKKDLFMYNVIFRMRRL